MRVNETQGGSSVNKPPEKLEFKPDEQKLARLARFRKVTLWLTLLLLVAPLVWLLMFPPKWPWEATDIKQGAQNLEESPLTPEIAPSGYEPPIREVIPTSKAEDEILTQALASGRLIDSSVNIALAQWKRAQALAGFGEANKNKVEEILKGIKVARVVSESAKSMVEIVRREMERLKVMSHNPGRVGLRVNAIYGAAREYWNFLAEEVADQEASLDAWEKAVYALGDGNEAEFEIKENVAIGYLRKSQSRQRRFYRAQTRWKETLSIGVE